MGGPAVWAVIRACRSSASAMRRSSPNTILPVSTSRPRPHWAAAWFGQIEAIRYTFKAEAPGGDLFRSWIWEPKTDQITYEGKD
jgi:hypothetical protein